MGADHGFFDFYHHSGAVLVAADYGDLLMTSQSVKAAYQREYTEQRRMFHACWADEVKQKMMADPWGFDEKAEIEARVKEFPADEKTIRGFFK